MLKHTRKRQTTDHVDPDLPITPMLDMSFQLLAFFIMTFQPKPLEGQIQMTLPKEEGGDPISFPSVSADKPVRYTIVGESFEAPLLPVVVGSTVELNVVERWIRSIVSTIAYPGRRALVRT